MHVIATSQRIVVEARSVLRRYPNTF